LAPIKVRIVSPLNDSKAGPILCYVTDRRLLAGATAEEIQQTLLQRIEAALAAGVDWIQIREKDLSGKECAQLTRRAVRMLTQSAPGKAPRARILVNDRLDVAISEHAGGVHLGENSLPVREVKRMHSSERLRDFLVGRSCHSLEAAIFAEQSGADYIFFGPIFATPSKAAYGAPQGVERLADVCRAVSIPVVAIGGITLANAGACLAAGASGIAAIRLFQDSPDLVPVVAELRKLAL
jgi:thiamine-phosphate pyrophosphorylase